MVNSPAAKVYGGNMLFFKRLLFCAPIVILFSVLSYAQNISNQSALKNAINNQSGQNAAQIVVYSSFTFTENLPEYSNKNIMIGAGAGFIDISGGSVFEGFKFKNSNLVFDHNYGISVWLVHFMSLSSGAAVNIYNSDLGLRWTDLAYNESKNGGAVYAENSEISGYVIGGWSNSAVENGGFIYMKNSSLNVNTDLSASDWIFLNNAGQKGGAIYAENSDIFLMNQDFDYNEAGQKGGGMYLERSTFTFTNIVFNSNEAREGGAFYADNCSSGDIMFSEFILNESTRGAVYLSLSENINFRNTSFANNQTTEGTVYVSSSANIRFRDVVFSSNIAFGKGAAGYIFNSKVFLENSNMIENTAQKASGFYVEKSTFQVSSSYFSSNFTAEEAGALHAKNSISSISGTTFYENVAQSSGGAAYFSGGSADISGFVFDGNSSGDSGGAIYVDGAKVILRGGKLINNNSFYGDGGAIYLSGTSASLAELILKEEIQFENNIAKGKANDIYLSDYSILNFDSSKDIRFSGGISASSTAVGSTIIKNGSGKVFFKGNTATNSEVKVNSGTLIMENNSVLNAKSVNVASGGKFELLRNSEIRASDSVTVQKGGILSSDSMKSFYAKTLNIAGVLKIGVNVKNNSADLIKADTINLDDGSSSIELSGNLIKGSMEYMFMQAVNEVSGTFKNSSGIYGTRAAWELDYGSNTVKLKMEVKDYGDIQGLSSNQQTVARLIDKEYGKMYESDKTLWKNVFSKLDSIELPLLKNALDKISGSFYANLFTAVSANRENNFFETLKPRYENEDKVWSYASYGMMKIKQDENTLGDMEASQMGLRAGWDIFDNEEDLLGGIMLDYAYHDITQEKDNAKIVDINLGAYGAWFSEHSEFKSAFLAGMQTYDAERKAALLEQEFSAEFSGFSLSFNNQAGYFIDINENISFKPFAELELSVIKAGSFSEKGNGAELIVDGKSYFRGNFFAGIGLQGFGKRGEWYINAGAGYLFAGAQNKIDAKFAQGGNKMTVKSAELGGVNFGGSIGGEIYFTDSVAAFINSSYGASEGSSNLSANIGARFKIF